MRSALAAALAAVLLTACAVPIGHFTAMGWEPHDEGLPCALVPATGRSCRWWILGVPLGLPHVEDAVADALAHAGGHVLLDADLVSFHPIYGVVGRHCYVVTGRAACAAAPRDGGRDGAPDGAPGASTPRLHAEAVDARGILAGHLVQDLGTVEREP